ncbi:peptide chain release factor H [Roseibium aggregatum]|uniref:Peptide chain release factor H n=1 Tax=Roseibium aggregatum TaxID=187304 RepID=A0A939EGH9_9HYPH|nr:peptide chain release factor H [Roseibium aggregatum]MBN9671335.1 peptide chain release factor H [Roseibium aggregatum]
MTRKGRTRLLVTSGDGPRECRLAVSHVLKRMEQEASAAGLRFEAQRADTPDGGDPASALVTLSGENTDRFARRWCGTVQWTSQSPFRPHHKRRNWFVGIFEAGTEEAPEAVLTPKALKVETFRSGGPGGQHQNTTDSGVRVTHLETGLSAFSTDERSQHRNRQVALDRLAAKFILRAEESKARDRSNQNQLHKQLERGNPVRKFKGERFAEAT